MDKFRLGLACSVEVVSVRHVRSSQSLFIEGYTYTDHSALGRAYIRCRSEIPMISRKVRTLVKYGFRRWILSNIINIKEKFHTFTMIRRCHNIHSLSTTIYIVFHRSDMGFNKILSRSMGWTKQPDARFVRVDTVNDWQFCVLSGIYVVLDGEQFLIFPKDF